MKVQQFQIATYYLGHPVKLKIDFLVFFLTNCALSLSFSAQFQSFFVNHRTMGYSHSHSSMLSFKKDSFIESKTKNCSAEYYSESITISFCFRNPRIRFTEISLYQKLISFFTKVSMALNSITLSTNSDIKVGESLNKILQMQKQYQEDSIVIQTL